jgi:HSP20 family protein
MRVTDLIPWRSESRGLATRDSRDINADPVSALQLDINRAFDDFWRMFDLPLSRAIAGNGRSAGETHIDVKDGEKEVVVTAELPGMSDADIDVFIDDGILTIRGEKKTEEERKEEGYLLRERRFGVVERSVRLPDGVDPDATKAVMKNGVLTVTIPKTKDAMANVKRVSVRKA